MKRSIECTLLAVAAAACVAGCGQKKTDLGQGGSVVSGSAGPAGTRGESHELQRCPSPVATIALVENPNGYSVQSSYNLPESPVPLIRLMAQQSGCFRVVDRAAGLEATQKEQELEDSGLVSKETGPRKGRGIAARYTITPGLTFSENDAGGQIGGLLGAIPFVSRFAGVAEGVKLKEAQVTLLMTDNETTEQIAASTGSVRVTDLGIGGLMLGRFGAGAAGWSHTNDGKVIAAAFLDAHNRLVEQVSSMAH